MTDQGELLITLNSRDWRVRRDVAKNTSTPADVLVALATDEDGGVRLAVAGNPNTPEHVRVFLALDSLIPRDK